MENLSFCPSTLPEIKKKPATVLMRGEKGQKPLMQKWRLEAVWEEEQLHQEKEGVKEFDLLIQEKMRIIISTEANILGRLFHSDFQ